MKRYRFTDILYICSGLLLIIGAFSGFIRELWVNIVFALGAAGYLLSFMLTPPKNKDLRSRRLHRMGFLSGLLFGISAAYRFIGREQQEWLLFFALGLVFMIYANLLTITRKNKQ
ncbi:hypothetical protein HR11_08205 [Porphyromonas macacae]|uniref:hypothetical protein n=1 Tax=Porphyromonas macacae TaxID=28115 RepID=UPI00052BEFE3|nr:hypothetical protein [Porphyromonas macacae]KGN98511.1 hypothetical protein HR11_08205 [Porphyromonas macacae]